jgi:hypothetical protein
MFNFVYICTLFIQFSHANEGILESKSIYSNKTEEYLSQKNFIDSKNVLVEKSYLNSNGPDTKDYTIYDTQENIGYTNIGDTIYGSDGSTSTTLGNTTYKSNGETTTRLGSTIYRSDGSTSTTIDNITINSNGTTCGVINGTTVCI